MNPINSVIKRIYKESWEEFSFFGKVTLFPILILIFPVFLFIALCLKNNNPDE